MDEIQGPERVAMSQLEQSRSTVLFLHDATVLDFSGHDSIADELGPVGNGGGRGWMAYQTIAIDPVTQRIHGLVNQQLHVRPESTRGRTTAQNRNAKDRETRNWLASLNEVGPTPEGCHWVHVADRGADTFEFLQALTDGKHDFVIRSCHDRAVGESRSDSKAQVRLHGLLETLPAMTEWEIETPSSPQKKRQLQAVGVRVTLRPPHVKKASYRSEPLTMNAVRVWEAKPPKGLAALEWILLTSEPVETVEQLRQVVEWYRLRWTSEEFHKAQKSGLGVEADQVQDADSLAALVAIRSVLAVWLFNGSRDLRDEQR
ncbi:MAG: IS4 family transposase, partial [Gemmataceae bacterium]